MSELQSKRVMRRQGPTPLRPIPQLCGRYKCDHVYLKDESKNPYGTFKDRRNEALLEIYKARDEAVFVHITSGNSGYSLGLGAMEFEKASGRKRTIVNIVDRKTPKKVKEMLKTCSIVVQMDLGKRVVNEDELVRIAKEASGYTGPEDNIICVENYRLEHGYGEIMHEVKRQLDEHGKKPVYIFCPIGSGELATEIAAEAEVVWGADAPRIIGVTIPQNVIMHAKEFIRKIRGTIADKISCGYTKFKEIVKNFVQNGRIELRTVKEREIFREYRYLNGIGINAEPSAAAAFAGAMAYKLKPEDVVVIVNTGKGIYDQRRVGRSWLRRIKKAAVYATFFLMAAVIAAIGAYSYALHRIDYRNKIEGEAYVHAREEAKREKMDGEDYAELPCRFLVERKEYGYMIPKKKIAQICKDISPWRIGDSHLELYNRYRGFSEGIVDRIIGSVQYDMTKRYNSGYYDDTLGGRLRRFGKWLDDNFNDYNRDKVFEFYFPHYDCWKNSHDYGRCMERHSVWKPPEISKDGKIE